MVEVPDDRFGSERLERAHAADAKHDLLLDAAYRDRRNMQPRRRLPIPWRVFLEVRVEQEQLHASQPHAPHLHEHAAVAERDGDDAVVAVGRHGRFAWSASAQYQPFITTPAASLPGDTLGCK